MDSTKHNVPHLDNVDDASRQKIKNVRIYLRLISAYHSGPLLVQASLAKR